VCKERAPGHSVKKEGNKSPVLGKKSKSGGKEPKTGQQRTKKACGARKRAKETEIQKKGREIFEGERNPLAALNGGKPRPKLKWG